MTSDADPAPSQAAAVATATRWASGVLVLGTVALGGYVALLLVGVRAMAWFVGEWLGVDADGSVGGLDLAGLVWPALALGWVGGVVLARLVASSGALGPRLSGVVAGVAGCALGALTFILQPALL